MKKTRLLFIAIAMTLVLALATSVVNAATITATRDTEANTMKVGERVTVTVKTTVPVNSAQFILKFDDTAFKYISASSDLGTDGIALISNNQVMAVLANANKTSDTTTFIFEAIADKEAAPFEIVGDTEFALNPAEGESTPQVLEDEVFKEEDSKVEVTVEEPKAPDTNVVDPGPSTGDDQNNEVTPPTNIVTPENPGSTENPGNSGNNSGSGLVDDDGNEINRIPQTGSVMPTVIFGVVVLGIVATLAIVLVKNKKNK